ncbi:MAG TPA: type I polyketide synthase, partial [Blastocatellia bacterium]|nr:type I polyketide synthase [Blastocatellia bacterium]
MTSIAETGCDIAIVGMACRFPGAANIDEFWNKLARGEELIATLSDDELLAAGVDSRLLDDPSFVKADGALDGIDLFDASFFGYTPREAELMDPQVRLFLEVAWEALENAAFSWDSNSSRVGVYAGASMNTYLLSNLYPNAGLIDSVGSFQTTILNNRDYLPLHVSYRLNLNGPSINVQTACSTSLTAVHLGCQSLLGRESDVVLAGGSSIRVPQRRGYLFEQGGILSPDGHCRAFDESAAGTVASSGTAAVVLKRLDDAVADRDFIYAVIKGTAANNDGAQKAGFTAPAIAGQASTVEEALAMSMVSPETVTYIEAHGTATPLGDPIEIAALTQAFRRYTDAVGFCRIGSVKTNLGHLDAAAGVAGLIKTALALRHRQIPPSLHFAKPNPQIDFDNSPFLVNTALYDWTASDHPRRAGVSSFGIGGTNVHAILEEAPPHAPGTVGNKQSIVLVLSAKTSSALDAETRDLAGFIVSHPEIDLSDAAYTLQTGRKSMAYRRAVVCGPIAKAPEVLTLLKELPPASVFDGYHDKGNRPVAFVFPGQGSQYAGMSRGIYDYEEGFRIEIDRCLGLLDSASRQRLRSVLFPEPGQDAEAMLQHTALAQPALFTVSYSLARQLMKWGIQPDSMIGHSIGEFVAACLSGVMELGDAIGLVALRGKLMGMLPPGSMIAVPLGEEETADRIFSLAGCSIAALNGPRLTIVSGSTGSITGLEESLSRAGISTKRLRVSHSFHSEMMDSVLGEFTAAVARVRLNAPRVPYVSNVTGTWITADQATNPEYYARHLRQTVRFHQGIGELMAEPDRVFVEVGPGGALNAAFGPEGTGERPPAIETLRRQNAVAEDEAVLKSAVARLWVRGANVDWDSVHEGELRNHVPLPSYPFERKGYWIEAPTDLAERVERPDFKQADFSKWFYCESWRRFPLPRKTGASQGGSPR